MNLSNKGVQDITDTFACRSTFHGRIMIHGDETRAKGLHRDEACCILPSEEYLIMFTYRAAQSELCVYHSGGCGYA